MNGSSAPSDDVSCQSVTSICLFSKVAPEKCLYNSCQTFGPRSSIAVLPTSIVVRDPLVSLNEN